MLKRFSVVALAMIMCISLVACGDSESGSSRRSSKSSKKTEGDFGKDSMEVNKLIADYFKAYEQCDIDKLEKLCGPENADFVSSYKNRLSAYEDSELYADKENLTFYYVMGIYIPATMMMSIDYLRFNADMDLVDDYYEKINDGKLAINYEIENIKDSDEADTLYYKEGLYWKTNGIEYELDKYIDGEVEDWYSIKFKINYTFDGDLYGYDENKTGDELYDITGELSEQIVRNIENNIDFKENSIYTLLVYKVDGEWFVYRPDIFMYSYMGVNYCPDEDFLESVNLGSGAAEAESTEAESTEAESTEAED